MPLYEYYTVTNTPRKLAKLLGLTFRRKPGPSGQFYRGRKPVGYVVREGVTSFTNGIQIPVGLALKQL